MNSKKASDGPVPAIELRDVTKRFPVDGSRMYTALSGLDIVVEPRQFYAVVGPTGCGKSTTLRLISGLERPSAGMVRVHGAEVSGIGKKTGFIFQDDAVFPWRTVLDNVSAGPRFRGVPKAAAREAARDWVTRVGLAGFENRYPHQLSGGMRKRVAMAQSLVNEPEILLMDEPFSALDVQTRSLMADELLDLWQVTRPAVVFVTHDLEEAIALADVVTVLTAHPGTVKARFAIDLPRPRRVHDVRTDPRFVAIYDQIWAALSSEVQAAYERSTARSPEGGRRR